MIPKNISQYRPPSNQIKVNSIHLFGKHLSITRPTNSEILTGDYKFLNGAIYGKDSFDNHGKAIVVGNPYAQELLDETRQGPKVTWNDPDVYVRIKPVGISVSLSRFENNTYIRLQTPENAYFDPLELELFKSFGAEKEYSKIVLKILNEDKCVQQLIRDIELTKTSYIHFFFHVVSSKLSGKGAKDRVYLTDVVNNAGESFSPINSTDKMYDLVRQYGFFLLPLAGNEISSFGQATKKLSETKCWQYIVYYNNNQDRVKITNCNYLMPQDEEVKSINYFELNSLIDKFNDGFFNRNNNSNFTEKTFISNLCQQASKLTDRQDQDFALANIEQLKRLARTLKLKILTSECYGVGLLLERGIFDTNSISPADRSWFSEKITIDRPDNSFIALTWNKLSNTRPTKYLGSKIFENELKRLTEEQTLAY